MPAVRIDPTCPKPEKPKNNSNAEMLDHILRPSFKVLRPPARPQALHILLYTAVSRFYYSASGLGLRESFGLGWSARTPKHLTSKVYAAHGTQ